MKSCKRALLYLRRRKKVSIALFLLLVLLFVEGLLGIILIGSLQDTQTALRRTFAGSFYVSTNWGLVGTQPESVSGFEFLNDEMAEQIGDFEGITAVNATAYGYLASDELTLIPGSHARNLKETDPADESYKNKVYFTKSPSYSFNSYSELAPEFRMGQYTLVKGRHIMPEDTHVAIISDELAEKNGLDVGDSYYVYDYDVTGAFPNYNGIGFDFTIVGIYHVEAQQKTTKFTNESDIAANKVFADTHTNVESKQRANDYVYYPFVYFFVDDPANIDEIMAAEQERDDIPWEYYLIEADETEYASVAEPLRSMHTTIAVIACVIGAGILILLYLVLRISLQNRRQEVRLYRCLGYSKRNILGQLAIEGLLLAALAFIPAAALAPPSAGALGAAVESMVSEQIEEPKEYSEAEIEAGMRDGSFADMMKEMQQLYLDEPVEIDINTHLTPAVLLSVAAAGLAVVLLFILLQSREMLTMPLR